MRRSSGIVIAVAFMLSLSACREHTVTVTFDPVVGDRYELQSEIDTDIARTLDGTVAGDRTNSRLVATEEVVSVDPDAVGIEVTVRRDGAAPRRFEARFDPTGRLSAIELVEGVPAQALGVDVSSDLPTDIASPPARPLAPGARWSIERRIDGPGAGTIRGTGRLESLGVEDGTDVATVVVELVVPLHSETTTQDGVVSVDGSQTVVSRTTYSLADGSARVDRTHIEGEARVTVAPPRGVIAAPVDGRIRYVITTRTHRHRID